MWQQHVTYSTTLFIMQLNLVRLNGLGPQAEKLEGSLHLHKMSSIYDIVVTIVITLRIILLQNSYTYELS